MAASLGHEDALVDWLGDARISPQVRRISDLSQVGGVPSAELRPHSADKGSENRNALRAGPLASIDFVKNSTVQRSLAYFGQSAKRELGGIDEILGRVPADTQQDESPRIAIAFPAHSLCPPPVPLPPAYATEPYVVLHSAG